YFPFYSSLRYLHRKIYHLLDFSFNILSYSSGTFHLNHTTTHGIYTLSLHDALPISSRRRDASRGGRHGRDDARAAAGRRARASRSEEHTSELQSRFELVCRLLLEKKKMIYR